MLTKEEAIDLGKRALACEHWKWMSRMRTIKGCTVLVHKNMFGTHLFNANGQKIVEGSLPDVRDPATLGCLLHLVRKAWNSNCLYAEEMTEGEWWCSVGLYTYTGSTEAEALIAALEEAL